MNNDLKMPSNEIAEVCRRHGVSRLSLFGSALGDDFAPDSDVDMLVEFEEGVRIGFFGLARIELELTDLLGRKVDLRTPAELSSYFREEVVESAEVQYAR